MDLTVGGVEAGKGAEPEESGVGISNRGGGVQLSQNDEAESSGGVKSREAAAVAGRNSVAVAEAEVGKARK